jgi:hypothetical protein
MATIGNSVLTLADWAKRRDPDGGTAKIVEMLSQNNAMLDDMLWQEGNLPTGHQATIRTSLPSVAWRLLNQGTAPSKSTTAQVSFQTGILEAWSEIDQDIAELNGDVKATRLSESEAFLEAMSQEVQQTMIYGTNANPEEFVGLASYYDSKTDNSGENIVDAGGTGSDNASIYLVGWGARAIYGIFPKGSKAGLSRQDMGLVTVETTAGIAGNRMRAYQEHFKWKPGLVVEDWRQGARIANIDVSNLIADGAGASVKVIEYMIQAVHKINKSNMGKFAFYTNRTVAAMLDIQAQNKANVLLKVDEFAGKRVLSFRGIPIRIVDAMLTTEARVV